MIGRYRAVVMALAALLGLGGCTRSDPVRNPSASRAAGETNATSSTESLTPPGSLEPSETPRDVTIRLDPTHTLELTIVDGSGLLLDARSATQVEQAPRDPNLSSKDIFAFNPSTEPADEVRLVWIGTICDRSAELRIAPQVAAISIAEGPHPACDLVALGRGVVLMFGQPVDASSILLELRRGRPF